MRGEGGSAAALSDQQENPCGRSKAARTNEGKRTFETPLEAAAYDEDGPSRVSSKRKSEILSVHEPYFTTARQRVQVLRPDFIPTAAIDEDAYRFHPAPRGMTPPHRA